LTSPTPAQLPSVALSAGHIVYQKLFFRKLGNTFDFEKRH
jgi:hypothetical protein